MFHFVVASVKVVECNETTPTPIMQHVILLFRKLDITTVYENISSPPPPFLPLIFLLDVSFSFLPRSRWIEAAGHGAPHGSRHVVAKLRMEKLGVRQVSTK